MKTLHRKLLVVFLVSTLVPSCVRADWTVVNEVNNNPIYKLSATRVEKRPLMFAPANQVELRLKKVGFLGASLSRDELELVSEKVLTRAIRSTRYDNDIKEKRFFLVSIDPDVLVVSPYAYQFVNKLDARARGDSGTVLNAMYKELVDLRAPDVHPKLSRNLHGRATNMNYVELVCAFPEIAGSEIYADAIGKLMPFNDAVPLLEQRLNVKIERHPNIEGVFQVRGC